MDKRIIYRNTASTKKEAEAEAIRLLEQVVEPEGRFQTIKKEESTDKEGYSYDAAIMLLPSATAVPTEDTPVAYIHRFERETPESKGYYRIYLLFDKERLPFIYRSITRLGFILALCCPTIRPEKAIPVEVVLTKEGKDILYEALSTVKEDTPYSSRIDKYVLEVKNAPAEQRIYILEDAGEDTEIVLNGLTGKTYKTEKAYLKALADIAGEEEVEQREADLLDDYRFGKAIRFVDFLEYELLRTEDYASIETHYEEYASAIGFKKEYMKHLTKKGKKYGSALEVALAQYLDRLLEMPHAFGGLTGTRVAEYLNVPAATLRKIVSETKHNKI